ncbi:MAG: ABC transporter permease [Acidimicrobiia bacterium]
MRGERLPRPKFSLRDLASEALAGMLARPVRAALTTLGTVLGIGALVATLGVSKTAGNRIVGRFNELAATQVTVEAANIGFGPPGGNRAQPVVLPWNVEDRLLRLNGVSAAGAIGDANVGSALVRSTPIRDPLGQTEFQMRVVGSSPGLLDALRGSMSTGRFFDDGSVLRQDRVVVLGANAAKRLNIVRVDNQPAIYIGDDLFTVIGIMGTTRRERSLLDAVLMPSSTANDRYRLQGPSKVVIETDLGAAQLIAGQAPVALNPNAPETLQVSAPADPRATRRAVESDVNSLFLVLGLVSLVVGAIGIANVTLVTVMERTGEIGLRRALGAARRHIAAQFLVESTVMGLLGGIIGASAGVLVVVSVAAAKQWTPVLAAWVPLVAPVLGAFVGLIAGLYPSLRAARMEPVEALRSGT